MNSYPKIYNIFIRDNNGKILEGVYSLPQFEYLAQNQWVFTEKIDGTNVRFIWDGEDLLIRGKTEISTIPTFLYTKLLEYKERLIKFLHNQPPLCLYGEGFGAKIQTEGKNYIADGVDFILFDVKTQNLWQNREVVEDYANRLGLKVVPIVGEGSIPDAIAKVKGGFISSFGDFFAEGIIAKPKIPLFNRGGNLIVTKIKHKDFYRGY